MSLNTDATWAARTSKAILLIRILVGWVFLSEGIQKFLFPDALGVGRFVKIGIPWPQVMAPFVGVVEIVCGTLLLVGLLTRLAAIPLVIDICVALYSTKIVTLAKSGLWSTLHEARTDVSMLLGLIFLLLVGGGAFSLDARFPQRFNPTDGLIGSRNCQKGVAMTLIAAASTPLVVLGDFWLALIGSAVWGLGMGVHESIIPAAVAKMVPQQRRPSAYGIFTAGYGVFWFIGRA